MRIGDCINRPHVLVEVNLTSTGNITDNRDPLNGSGNMTSVSTSEIFRHSSASLNVSGEEIGIVIIVLILWIAAIALFINRWGKIRLMEPYHPYFRPETTAEPTSEDGNEEADMSRRASNQRQSIDVPPQRRKSIFPGPITLEIPTPSPRHSLGCSQMIRRKSVLELWPGQSASQIRRNTERRRSCLSDFSACRRGSTLTDIRYNRQEYPLSSYKRRLSPTSCYYNSNRSVSLHPYFYLNSKTPPTLRYTPASTERSGQSSPSQELLSEQENGESSYNVAKIEIHEDKESSESEKSLTANKKILRQFSFDRVDKDENGSIEFSPSDTCSCMVSEV